MASKESSMVNSSSSSSDDDDEYHSEDESHYHEFCTSFFHENEENCTNHPSELSNNISNLSLNEVAVEVEGEDSTQTIISRRRQKLTNNPTGLETSGNKCSLVEERRVFRERNKRVFNGDEKRYTGGGGELTVKVGKKSMLMDWEEVQACTELGFNVDVPGWVPVSTPGSNREMQTRTSSGRNSPIATWHYIASPGDDDIKDVKARLKIWAQAVGASVSR